MKPAPADILDATSLADALRPLLLRTSRRLRREALTAGLSSLDTIVLARIRNSPGVGVSELADAERVSRPVISSRIKRLTAAGLIVRSHDVADGRRAGLSITRAGQRKLDAVRRLRNDWLAGQLAMLSAEDRARLAAAVEPLALLVGSQT